MIRRPDSSVICPHTCPDVDRAFREAREAIEKAVERALDDLNDCVKTDGTEKLRAVLDETFEKLQEAEKEIDELKSEVEALRSDLDDAKAEIESMSREFSR